MRNTSSAPISASTSRSLFAHREPLRARDCEDRVAGDPCQHRVDRRRDDLVFHHREHVGGRRLGHMARKVQQDHLVEPFGERPAARSMGLK